MGQEVDWRDLKQECLPSVTLDTFTGALVGLIEQLGDEHRVYLAKKVANLFPFRTDHHEADLRQNTVASLPNSAAVLYSHYDSIQAQGGASGMGCHHGSHPPVQKKKPSQIAASCTCKWCCKWTVCEHSSLVASVFSPKYNVPVKLIAETPPLRKKTNSVRGIAGPRRKRAMMEIRRQKAKTMRKLAYMD